MAAFTLKTFQDIYTAVVEELKIPTSDTNTLDRIKRDINIGYKDISSRKNWPWLNKFITLTHKETIDAGTASVTEDSRSVTLSSAPSISVQGYWIKFDGNDEIYRVAQHTAGATAVTLESSYTQATNASLSYKLWTDRIPLPVDCDETIEVTHQLKNGSLDGIGRQRFRELVSLYPTAEGYPLYYSTNDYKEVAPYEGSDVETSSTRSSSGLLKTIVFGADVSATLEVGDRIQVSGAGDQSYNGEFTVRSVSTTTITYVGLVRLSETSTADVSISVKKLTNRTAEETYRELWIHPSIYTDRDITLHVDYQQRIVDLEADSDEPLIPIDDRIALVYFALSRSWVKQRNPEMAAQNERMYENKVTRMEAKAGDSADYPNIYPDRTWASLKRSAGKQWRRWRRW